ncbi:hypothetical protein [Mycoplasmopsis gallopavonis]|uniref:Uncharacterized protein n=1 Tax=Mycoplasmopsis gallopavonis TaxID=76629 RepID=A0A449AZB0_9BACT|nr:hypothetical protein [Mycoplasmopsis gallopavonis]RIV16416.1 hypothetical protein D1113_02460 [Mycoplasmopsis gallopavonis]VEU72868.1 Uncharacterised protein [Mycoplasmopsis gallopavonis]
MLVKLQDSIQNLTSSPLDNPGSRLFKHTPFGVIIAIFIIALVLAVVSFAIYFYYSLRKIKEYKNAQLADFLKENPKRKNVTYQNSGMYLPSWERAKYNAPLFFGVLFTGIAIIFFIGMFS